MPLESPNREAVQAVSMSVLFKGLAVFTLNPQTANLKHDSPLFLMHHPFLFK
jgi:hypothetical protein